MFIALKQTLFFHGRLAFSQEEILLSNYLISRNQAIVLRNRSTYLKFRLLITNLIQNDNGFFLIYKFLLACNTTVCCGPNVYAMPNQMLVLKIYEITVSESLFAHFHYLQRAIKYAYRIQSHP